MNRTKKIKNKKCLFASAFGALALVEQAARLSARGRQSAVGACALARDALEARVGERDGVRTVNENDLKPRVPAVFGAVIGAKNFAVLKLVVRAAFRDGAIVHLQVHSDLHIG